VGILHGTYNGRIVPYQRMTQGGRFSARAKRYHASQNRLVAHMFDQCTAQQAFRIARRETAIVTPYRFDMGLTVAATKAGNYPGNAGDADNLGVKCWLDAAQHGRIVAGDDLRWYRGGSLSVHLGDAWRFVWCFWWVEGEK